MQKKNSKIEVRYKLIYNPNAGKKKSLLNGKPGVSLEEIQELFAQYQISVDYFPTKGPGDGTRLARESIKEKYNYVIAAGGDGTISEVAAGLIGSEMVLGILPLGTFMNTALALSIPQTLELAVATIKLGRVRKIDVGQVRGIDDFDPKQTFYFLENAGVGFEAQLQEEFLKMEKGNLIVLPRLVKTIFEFYVFKVRIVLDKSDVVVQSGLIEISNGPITGANFTVAPKAKLNDHLLTVSVFRMKLWELVLYLLRMKQGGVLGSKKIQRFQSKTVRIFTKKPMPVHVDARIFGTTPVEFSVLPSALNVITGFPKSKKSALLKRTVLDP